MQWGGGKTQMKGKDCKFSPGQTNKNPDIPPLFSALCRECEPVFVF